MQSISTIGLDIAKAASARTACATSTRCACAQSRTVRLITNVEVFAAVRDDAHVAVKFCHQRILGQGNANANRLGRPPRRPQRRRLENSGQAGHCRTPPSAGGIGVISVVERVIGVGCRRPKPT